MRKWHLVTYDIREDKRLRRVARVMEGYGERVQYSVFRCRLTPTELERLRWELLRVIEREDSVLILPLCAHCASGVAGATGKREWDVEQPTFTIV